MAHGVVENKIVIDKMHEQKLYLCTPYELKSSHLGW